MLSKIISSLEAVRPFTENRNFSSQLVNLFSQKGYPDRQLAHWLSVDEAQVPAYKTGERLLRTGAAQKFLEKVSSEKLEF